MSSRASRAGLRHRLAASAPSPLALIFLAAAVGLVLCAWTNALSREGGDPTQLVYWAGVLLIVVPIAARVSREDVSLRERFWLVALFGLSLYAIKVVRDPFLFTFPDEPIHATTPIRPRSTTASSTATRSCL